VGQFRPIEGIYPQIRRIFVSNTENRMPVLYLYSLDMGITEWNSGQLAHLPESTPVRRYRKDQRIALACAIAFPRCTVTTVAQGGFAADMSSPPPCRRQPDSVEI